jgi:hypothetical protein
MLNKKNNVSVSPSVSHDNKENCSPSASNTDMDAIIENDDASASEAPSITALEALGVLSK